MIPLLDCIALFALFIAGFQAWAHRSLGGFKEDPAGRVQRQLPVWRLGRFCDVIEQDRILVVGICGAPISWQCEARSGVVVATCFVPCTLPFFVPALHDRPLLFLFALSAALITCSQPPGGHDFLAILQGGLNQLSLQSCLGDES